MKCRECGELVTVDKSAVIRYEMAGLPHVELHGVEVRQCGACGKSETVIPRIGQLHSVLAGSFVTQTRMLAPAEIKFLRKHIGLSGVDFAQRMGVTAATVSRWENGAQPMGAVADRLLRLLVLNHEPAESYAVEDLLKELTDIPAPDRLASVALHNSRSDGWRS